MPTVPPTCRRRSSFEHDGVVVPGVTHIDAFLSNGEPTPDPDLDDVVLTSVVVGDAVGAITADSSLNKVPEYSNPPLKPRISLTNLKLHSPSSLLGTPFDASPRFEYPFPISPSSVAEPELTLASSLPLIMSPMSANSASILSLSSTSFSPPTMPPPRLESSTRSSAPTHLKLLPKDRDPPVPPGLAKKRRSMGIAVPSLPNARVRSSSILGSPEDLNSGSPRSVMCAMSEETLVRYPGDAKSFSRENRRGALEVGKARRQ